MTVSVALILFLLVIIRNTLFWVSLWQLKEYRLDRLFVHVRDTAQGKKALLSLDNLLFVIILALYIVGIFSDALSRYLPLATALLFAFLAFRVVRDVVQKHIKRPIFTFKAIGVSGLSLLLVATILLFPLTDFSLWMVIVAFALPLEIACIVALFAFPTEIYTDIFMQRAKEKRKRLPHLQVIAVSGSYGKSSTKEIIAHLLAQKYSVVKTTLSQNTPLAIAKTLLTKVKVSTDFFIVELGAYKRGEIKQLADIVGPTMSVTTSVSDQHLALYGSMEDVVLSELELLESLPKDAIMLMNGNSAGTKLLAEKVKKGKIIWYKTGDATSRKKDTVYGMHVRSHINGVDWIYANQRKTLQISSPLFGEHTVENILPAVFIGMQYGLTDKQITNAMRTLSPMPKTMEKVQLLPGVSAIDDTFNASPESVASAVAYLLKFSKRKILVLSPLIELGKMSEARHEEIGQQLANIDIVCLTNKNYIDALQKGIDAKKGKTKIVTGSYIQIATFLKETLQKGDAIVFEGKEAGIVEKYLL